MLLKRLLPQQHAPRWIITVIDLVSGIVALFVAFLLRFEFRIPEDEWDVWVGFLPVYVAVRLVVMRLFKTSSGIIRHTGLADARRIILTNLSSTVYLLLQFGFRRMVR